MDLFDESETKGDGLRYGNVSAHLRAERDEQATPAETINTALCCAEGEAAIEEYEERAAREWLAALVAERDRLRDITRQRDEAEARAEALTAAFVAIEGRLVTILRDQDVPLYACRYCNRIGADHVANVEHAEWCLITTARAALAAMPAELLAQRERERAQITAALSLLAEIEEPIASTPNGSIFRFRAAMGYLRAALGATEEGTNQ